MRLHSLSRSCRSFVYLSSSVYAIWQSRATYVDEILKGTKPADLSVEQPTKHELVLNLKTAKTLSLKMPPSLVLLADAVIQ